MKAELFIALPGSARRTCVSLGIIDVQPRNSPISKVISRTTGSDLPRKSRRAQPDRKTAVLAWPTGLQPAHGNLAQPIISEEMHSQSLNILVFQRK